MDLGVMIEGQEGLGWDLWRRIVRFTEDAGFESLWRSDHFHSLMGARDRDALETFISFVVAAEETERVRFGPLVASMTFRHPSLLARMAAQLDQLSGGRFVLGVGAGWNVGEHEAFGLSFPSLRERMDRLEEGVQVALALLGDEPASFEGRYYQLRDAVSSPKPTQRPLPLLVGGRGERRTLRITARYAQEWNFAGVDLDEYRRLTGVLAAHCEDVGRDPSEIRHSQMAGFVIGRDEAELRAHFERIATQAPALVQAGGRAIDADQRQAATRPRRSVEEILAVLATRGWLIGTPDAVVEQIGRLEEAGISGVMLQHHALSDFETLELVASQVLPQVQR